jgi:hypothetical protein
MLKYNQQLIQAVLWDSPPIAKIVNVKVIKDAPCKSDLFR